MSAEVSLSEIVYDESIYPRSEYSQATVTRYAEALQAGDVFPPIVLESDTNRLLDGMHRAKAHSEAGRPTIAAVWHVIPDGVPPKLYAASLSSRHGDRLSGDDLREIAREIVRDNPDFDQVIVAKYAGVTQPTVSRWTRDITDQRRDVRRLKVLLLKRAGWSERMIADELGISQTQVNRDMHEHISVHLSEDMLRDAGEDLPIDVEDILEQIREDRIFSQFSDEERDLLKRLRSGETVVVSMHKESHPRLISWADSAGLFVRIDRRSPWGNPFEMPADGDRETVIQNYETHYLPHKPSLTSNLDDLRGKALGCWCAPEPCHGDVLKARAET